jgi:molybdopterin converting factor small subunit
MGQEESLEIEKARITLREFLEELAMMSGRPNIKYVESGAQAASDDWEVLINDRDVQESGGMDMDLNEGDAVTVNMQVIGGG